MKSISSKVTRNYIAKHKSKIGIISSIFFHSILFLSFKTDVSRGNTNTPIDFTEIIIIAGRGESIQNSRGSQAKKKIMKIHNQQNSTPEMKKKSTSSKSEIPINSKTNETIGKQKEQKKETNKKQNNESSTNKKLSIRGNKSNKNIDESLKGKLKGKGKTSIICKKCLEPIYSQQSIRRGLEGVTTVKVTIDTTGLVIKAIITNSSGHKDIDKASIKAALNSTFRPISEEREINIKYEHKIKNFL